MTFEKHLSSVSRADSQSHGISRKSWQVFHDRLLFGRCFRFFLPFSFWTDTHLRLHTLSVVPVFLTGGVFECGIAHRRSVAVLYMLNKIRCNPMHPLYGAPPVPYVPVRVTHGSVVSHW